MKRSEDTAARISQLSERKFTATTVICICSNNYLVKVSNYSLTANIIDTMNMNFFNETLIDLSIGLRTQNIFFNFITFIESPQILPDVRLSQHK